MNFFVPTTLVELCARKGVRHAVLCPGSRSAPLTLAFARNRSIQCWTFSDERSAAFIALGIAQQTKSPVVLVCTSGSAAYNFAPAIAEAYFQNTPLIILTADRPAEWIDQLDGQTIRQRNLYGNHVKKYFELPQEPNTDDGLWHTNRLINEAINLAISPAQGPIHINAPFREPLYPGGKEKIIRRSVRLIESLGKESGISVQEWSGLIRKFGAFKKVLIVGGQQDADPNLCKVLKQFTSVTYWPVVGDVLSNLHPIPDLCKHSDTFLGQITEVRKELLRPDLLVTFGKSLIAKNLKIFLRKNSPREHWHLQSAGETADTFQSLTRIIPIEPLQFFKQLLESKIKTPVESKAYQQAWHSEESNIQVAIEKFFKGKNKGEFEVVKKVIESLPPGSNLHLANSMSVRYANHIGLAAAQKNITVFSNRGTSGIDGCTSTAIGHSLTSKIPNVLITGDLAFFYDRNAFWHNYKIPNLYIILLNNHGGIIFNLIDGPSAMPEAEEFFITRQRLNARAIAREFGFVYQTAAKINLKAFFRQGRTIKILEIESTQSASKQIFESFRKHVKKQL